MGVEKVALWEHRPQGVRGRSGGTPWRRRRKEEV